MSHNRKHLAALAAIPLILLFVFFASLPFVVKTDVAKKNLTQKIEEMTHGTFVFERFHFSYWPRLSAEMQNVVLLSENKNGVSLKAQSLKLNLRLFASLFRKTDVSGIEIRSGEFEMSPSRSAPFKKIMIRPFRLKVSGVERSRPMKIVLEGDLEGIPKTLFAKLSLALDQFERWDWNSAAFDGKFELRDLDLNTLREKFLTEFAYRPRSGKLAGQIYAHKSQNDPWLNLDGKVNLQKFIYEMKQEANTFASSPLDTNLNATLSWNPNTEEIFLKQGNLVAPLGNIEASGRGLIGTQEIKEMRIAGSALALEMIPQYFIALKDAIPLNIGFSGHSDIEMMMKGTVDHLSMQGNWDLTPTLLTYGRYFSKPKDMPFNLTFDLLLRDSSKLSGDFSLRFQELSAKSSIVDWDLNSGSGQINVLTNKFKLVGWEKLLPPFEKFELQGEMKVLANVKGNLTEHQATETMMNVTLENGSMLRENGKGIKNAYLAFDCGPLSLEVKQVRFEIDDAPVSAELSVQNPGPHQVGKGKIEAPHAIPAHVIAAASDFLSEWISAGMKESLQKASSIAQTLFPPQEPLENISAEIHFKDKQWAVNNLQFQGYNGEAKINAGLDENPVPPTFWLDPEVNRLSLARYFERLGKKEKPIEGNLFFKMHLQGSDLAWDGFENRLQGKGTFSVTNGEFQGFDLLSVLGKIDGLLGVKDLATGKTSFDDLRSSFTLKDGKIVTEKLLMLSRDMSAEGNGETSLDGMLNYRINLFLSTALTDKILGPLLGTSAVAGDKQFGPVPLLLTGPVDKPEMKADPNLLPRLQDDLQRKKTQKVLRNFLPEDFLFEKRTTS